MLAEFHHLAVDSALLPHSQAASSMIQTLGGLQFPMFAAVTTVGLQECDHL